MNDNSSNNVIIINDYTARPRLQFGDEIFVMSPSVVGDKCLLSDGTCVRGYVTVVLPGLFVCSFSVNRTNYP